MKQSVYEYSYSLLKERNAKIVKVVSILIGIILFLTLFLNFVLFSCFVRSDSMESDIAKNSAVFVSPLIKTPNRGDVFYISSQEDKNLTWYKVFANKFVSLFSFQKYEPFAYSKQITERDFVRRVIALPGDTLYIQDYIVYVKPQEQDFFLTEFELCKRPYNIHIYSIPAEWDGLGPCKDMEPITLGEDEYFVLADNRIEAVDSRLYGPVKQNRLKGKVLFEYFPFDKLRIF